MGDEDDVTPCALRVLRTDDHIAADVADMRQELYAAVFSTRASVIDSTLTPAGTVRPSTDATASSSHCLE